MNLLEKAFSGVVKKPLFMVLYGPPGRGKSTFASKAPAPLFCDVEGGTNNLNTTRLYTKSFDEVMTVISNCRGSNHQYQTLVIDTLDKLEPMLWDVVCKLDGSRTIDEAQKGYGKGYTLANKYWSQMIDALLALRDERGMHVIAIAHSQVKAFNDPMLLQAYDRHILKINEKAAALWREAVDLLGFTNYETFLKIGQTEKKNKAMGDGKRKLYVEGRPSFDAKTRFAIDAEYDLDFKTLADAIGLMGEKSLIVQIQEMLPSITDEELRVKILGAIEQAGDSKKKLEIIRDRLKAII